MSEDYKAGVMFAVKIIELVGDRLNAGVADISFAERQAAIKTLTVVTEVIHENLEGTSHALPSEPSV